MARTLAERWRESPGEQILEGFLHVATIGAAPLAIFAGFVVWGFPGAEIVGGAAASVPGVVTRELVDSWPIESVADTLLDSAQIVAGGALGGLCFALVT